MSDVRELIAGLKKSCLGESVLDKAVLKTLAAYALEEQADTLDAIRDKVSNKFGLLCVDTPKGYYAPELCSAYGYGYDKARTEICELLRRILGAGGKE